MGIIGRYTSIPMLYPSVVHFHVIAISISTLVVALPFGPGNNELRSISLEKGNLTLDREISNHNVGKMLGTCWEHVGKMLGKCWENVGNMLGKCWENVGNMLGDLPEKGWENPFVLKMLDEHRETKLIGLRQQFFAIESPFKKQKMTQ